MPRGALAATADPLEVTVATQHAGLPWCPVRKRGDGLIEPPKRRRAFTHEARTFGKQANAR